jgi:predicted nuclease of restriction endonuclease-like (RecB) superfamily
MTPSFQLSPEYTKFLEFIKQEIIQARNKAIRSVNNELINLYFFLGKEIVLKQENSHWGDDLIGQIEKDIKKDLPNIKGFSRSNLFYMKKFYLFFQENQKIPQLVGQIPWGHIRVLLDKLEDKSESFFYIQKTLENSWSRTILEHQISLNLYARQGKILSNFDAVLPVHEQQFIQEQFKKSYILDFLDLSEKVKEKELEKMILQNISDFLLEMGKGFAFVGKQHKLTVRQKEFFVDLLFYNYILKRFVVIELKTTEFKPEHLGQIGFYIATVDKDIKTPDDKGTIGLIICKTKDTAVVEYALSNTQYPTGIAEYKFLSELPKDIREVLPSETEIQQFLEHNEKKYD